jgi:hypothetical protein
MKIRLVVAIASAAVALGLTVTIVGIVGAAGVATAVCAKAGSVAANTIANSVFFILFAPVY